MDEREYTYSLTSEGNDLNEFDYLKPYGYQRLYGAMAEEHSKKMGFDFPSTMKYGLGWVLISLTLEIERPVKGSVRLEATTWHSGKKGPFYRREFVFRDSEGVTFKGCTYSALINLKDRKVFSGTEVPFLKVPALENHVVSAAPLFKPHAELELFERRKVYNSYIDFLGHVNNLRYSEFAYDALNEEEKKGFCGPCRIEMYFRSEIKPSDEFEVYKGYSDGAVIIKGTVGEEDSFYSVFRFER